MENKTDNAPDTNSVFKVLDEIVKKALEKEDIESELMTAYYDFFNKLKETTGTAAGFNGLSEYLFFQAIRLYLEEHLPCEFEKVKPKNDEGISIKSKETDPQIILTRGLKLKAEWAKTTICPDIVVYKKKEPVAIFEIKVNVSSPDTADKDVSRYRNNKVPPGIPIYFVFFQPPGGKALKHYTSFLEENPKRAYAILGDPKEFPEPWRSKGEAGRDELREPSDKCKSLENALKKLAMDCKG